MYVVLVYDISQEKNGAKRWSKVFKISKPQLEQLQQEMKPYIDTELDSVIIFKSRQEKWLDKEFWGKKEDKTSFFL